MDILEEEANSLLEIMSKTTEDLWWPHITDDSAFMTSYYIGTNPSKCKSPDDYPVGDGQQNMDISNPYRAVSSGEIIAIIHLQEPRLADNKNGFENMRAICEFHNKGSRIIKTLLAENKRLKSKQRQIQ